MVGGSGWWVVISIVLVVVVVVGYTNTVRRREKIRNSRRSYDLACLMNMNTNMREPHIQIVDVALAESADNCQVEIRGNADCM